MAADSKHLARWMNDPAAFVDEVVIPAIREEWDPEAGSFDVFVVEQGPAWVARFRRVFEKAMTTEKGRAILANAPAVREEARPRSDPHSHALGARVGTLYQTPRFAYGVTDVRDGVAELTPYSGGKEAGAPIYMPAASVPLFAADMNSRLSIPPNSRHPVVDDLLSEERAGRAQRLGKGHDGVAYRVGDHVVKVSTTVPYQPHNAGHRTPEEAIAHTQKEAATMAALRAAGVPGVPPAEVVVHGGRAFLIRPYLEVPASMTKADLDTVYGMVDAAHKAGYAIGDQIQVGRVGRDWYFMDLGSAFPNATDYQREGDLERLDMLYHQHGEHRMPRGAELVKHLDTLRSLLEMHLAYGEKQRELNESATEHIKRDLARYQVAVLARLKEIRRAEGQDSRTGLALLTESSRMEMRVRAVLGNKLDQKALKAEARRKADREAVPGGRRAPIPTPPPPWCELPRNEGGYGYDGDVSWEHPITHERVLVFIHEFGWLTESVLRGDTDPSLAWAAWRAAPPDYEEETPILQRTKSHATAIKAAIRYMREHG